MVTSGDQTTFDCGPGACDIDYTGLAVTGLGAVATVGGVPGVVNNPVLGRVVMALGDLTDGWDRARFADDVMYDRVTWRDAFVTIGGLGLGVVAATAGGSLAMIAAVGGAVIAVAQLGSEYDLLLNAQQRCLFNQRSAACSPPDPGLGGGGDAGVGGDAGTPGPCPGSPTAIVCGDPPICLEPASNHMHCGGCNNPCSSGVCTDGVCLCPTAGEIECSGACVNPQSDPANCGRYGQACAADEMCAPAGLLPSESLCTPASDSDFDGVLDIFCLPGIDQCLRRGIEGIDLRRTCNSPDRYECVGTLQPADFGEMVEICRGDEVCMTPLLARGDRPPQCVPPGSFLCTSDVVGEVVCLPGERCRPDAFDYDF